MRTANSEQRTANSEQRTANSELWKVKLKKFIFSPVFLSTFIIPNSISVIYFGIIASPVYVSTSTVIVTNPIKDSDNLTSLLSGSSGASTSGAYILKSYIQSWDEFNNIFSKINLKTVYGNGDFVSRYAGLLMGFHNSDIGMWHYYQKHVVVDIDSKTGLTTIDIKNYRPDIANQIAQLVLQDSINHINAMNHGAEDEFVATSETHSSALREAIAQDESALSEYRKKSFIYDPSPYYSSILDQISRINEKSTDISSQYAAIYRSTPNSPIVLGYREQLSVLRDSINKSRNDLITLSDLTPQYNALAMRRDMDMKLLESSELAMQQARIKASQNHYYLNIISSPSKPTSPELPHRIIIILEVIAVTAILWTLLR